MVTIYKTFTQEHLGCILHHFSREGLFLGAFNFLAFIIGRVKCITCIPKLIFISRKKPIKINNFPGGEKKKEKEKRLGVVFWNCTTSMSIKAVFTIFVLGTALISKNNLKRKEVLVERGSSPCQMVVEGNPDSCWRLTLLKSFPEDLVTTGFV